jgi:glutamate-1-semialdehyde 2,1-aminomutase
MRRAQRVLRGHGIRKEGADVPIVSRTQGAYLWMVDGARFIDHDNAAGRIVIGHADPRIDRAAAETAAKLDLNSAGVTLTEVELAERIVGAIPSAEVVRFVSSEAVALLLARRIAAIATKRTRTLVVRSRAARNRMLPGLDGADTVCWSDVVAMTNSPTRGRSYAALVVAPDAYPLWERAAARQLQATAGLAAHLGAVLIFDERTTAFRHHLGGYQAIAGIRPDLTLFGTTLGNGYGIAGVTGGASLTDLLGEQPPIADYLAPPHAVSAATATFDLLASGGVGRLWSNGDRLRKGLQRAIRDGHVSATVTGIGSTWSIKWNRPGPRAHAAAARFRAAMLDAGVLLPANLAAPANLNAAFSEDDIDETVEIAAAVLKQVA